MSAVSHSGQGTFDEYANLMGLEDEDMLVFPLLEDHVEEKQPTSPTGRANMPAGVREGPAETRRRTRRGQKFEPGVGSVFALSLGDRIAIDKVLEDWPTDELREIANDVQHFGGEDSEVLLMKIKLGDLDCFILEIGVIVCWGCSRPELGMIAAHLKKYTENNHELIAPGMYEDDFVYIPASLRGAAGSQISYIRGDVVYLSTDSALERLSYSYAFAQSVKLDGYEDAVAKAISAVKEIPGKIVKSGEVGMTPKELNQRIGELYIHRSNLNLHSDILDTPNCMWDLDSVSAVYRLCRKYQDIEKRLHILNHRLDVMKDMYEMVQSEINLIVYTRLEMTVVLLIVIEVLIDILLILIPLWGSSEV